MSKYASSNSETAFCASIPHECISLELSDELWNKQGHLKFWTSCFFCNWTYWTALCFNDLERVALQVTVSCKRVFSCMNICASILKHERKA